MKTLLRNNKSLLSFLLTLTVAAILPEAYSWSLLTSPPVSINHRIKSILYLDRTDGSGIEALPLPLHKDESIWKTEGERLIMKAIVENGGRVEDVDIQWKPGQIIVIISGDSLVQADTVVEEDELLEYDEDTIDEREFQEDEDEVDDNFQEEEENEGEENEEDVVEPKVVSMARAINIALGEEGEESIGHNIAVHHSIEVTSPGASDELYGIMFQSYKGFDVIVETFDPKNKKDDKTNSKIIFLEGKLVERNEKQTIVNVKGRIKKLKNELVIRVKLPKAKKEKNMK